MVTVIFTEETIDDLDIAIDYYTNISSQLDSLKILIKVRWN